MTIARPSLIIHRSSFVISNPLISPSPSTRIAKAGYQPEPNWIDDGVILRLAPLWELIPIWKSEPKKYWERLEQGDYDWSHIAMKYWPERVRVACRANKLFAIAHGHEEWYVGG